jgi:glycosyltransferase involved in cell wall biosynthesis
MPWRSGTTWRRSERGCRCRPENKEPKVEFPPHHIIFVSLDFYPDDQAVSQLFADLLVAVRRDAPDTRITVLCGFPMGAAVGVPDVVPRRENLEGVEILRCGFRVRDKSKLSHRALLYASFLLHAGWRLLRLGRGSLVFGVTSPPFGAHLLWLASRIARFRYQYMFLDIYPEALFALGRLNPQSVVARCWMALNRLSYRGASMVAVLGRDMIPLLQDHYGIPPSRISYIPHWSAAEVERPTPFNENTLAARLGLREKFVVQYSGNMGLLHDIDGLVRAADRLRDDPRIHFLFIGKGRRRAAAERLARDLDVRNITWLDFAPRECLPETLGCCHAALISLRRDMEGVAVPSKLYGILASGRAVVAQVPRASEIARVVEEEGCGIVVEPDDVTGLAEAIRMLASSPERVERMGVNAFRAYRSRYSLQTAVSAFEQLWGISRSEPEPGSVSPV